MTYIINDNGIDRPMTDDEAATYEQLMADVKAARKAEQAEQKAREAAKASARGKLAALGLTDDEIAALIP